MGFLGSTRGLTPALDLLARDSIVFTRAFSQAPITTVSHATILSGTFPPFHRVNAFGAPLPSGVPYLPQTLHDAGYRTAAFVGSIILDPQSGTAPGFERGFGSYDAGFRLQRPGEDRYHSVERRGDEVAARALKWLGTAGTGPWFLWVHLFDAHDPYDPPADLKRRFASEPYDGEIASVDRLAGKLAQAAGPETVVAITADHGEALGDHGESTHGVLLFDEVLQVPLMIRLPRRASAGVRVTAQVRLADVAPTLLEAAGLPVPPAMQGASLLPLVRPSSRTLNDRPAYAETDYPRQAFGWSPLAAWRADHFLLVRAPAIELYDTAADPAASHNLASTRARVVDGMSAELEQFIKTSDRSGGSGGLIPPRVDPAVAERLAALGYVSGSSARAGSGVNPRDRIAIANALHAAVIAVEEGAFQKAIPLLERVTASEPDIPLAQLQLGVARTRQRQYARAIDPLTRAVALEPEQMIGHYQLGVSLYETGQLNAAASHFEIVASKMPDFADARYSLGSVYARIDRVPDALSELRAAIALEPRHFRANLLAGRILTLQHRAAAAIPYLRTAVEVDPRSAEARAFLDEALKIKN